MTVLLSCAAGAFAPSVAATITNPATRRMLCCARAVTRHAAAPPRSVMTLRRFNCSNCIRPPAILGQFAGYRTGGDKASGYTPHLQPLGGWRASRRTAMGQGTKSLRDRLAEGIPHLRER